MATADQWNRRADRRRGFGLFIFRPLPRLAQRWDRTAPQKKISNAHAHFDTGDATSFRKAVDMSDDELAGIASQANPTKNAVLGRLVNASSTANL